jgi:hypothetical protein
MGKKAAKKAEEVDDSRKPPRRRGKDDEPLMLAVQRCPPRERLVFEWVAGNGLGDDAVVAAQRAFEKAYDVRLARAHERAASFEADDCPPRCRPGRRTILGPLSGTQGWEIDSAVTPMRASTWNWVGYIVLVDCGPE